MKVEYRDALANMPEEKGEPIRSRIDIGGISSEMVGSSDQFERVRDYLLARIRGLSFIVVKNWIFVIGMAGVGKTTLAKKVFEDPMIQRHFELRAWVKVGRKCESNETLRCILAQVDPNTRDQMLTQGEDGDDDFEKLVGVLEEILKDKKCLIVMDDVWGWDRRLMDRLRELNVGILLTSRLRFDKEPPSFEKMLEEILFRRMICGHKGSPLEVVGLLSDEESKKLLGEKVFGEEGFPPHLEKLGEKIAKKCEGLPLMIVKVSELLSEKDKTPEFWTEVAERQHNPMFEDAYDQISEVLFPSYDYLPQYLKMLFLYLGAFPPYSNIDITNIFNLMNAEGFVQSIGTQKDFTIEYIGKKLLTQYHLMLIESGGGSMFTAGKFRVHSCWQHLCRKEASKIKFLHVLQSWDNVMKDQRRLGAHCNTLFAFKQVSDSVSDCASTIRSLLFLGPYHRFPVSIPAKDYKLLWVLDALRVRFYHVPLEILKLVCLKYLSLTCNNEIPISVSNLFQLQTLIIGQHMKIKKRGCDSYVPVEIWNMQELQHIGIRGRDLPTPNSDATLDKLTCLRGVSVKSCTREILKRIPNLNEIRIGMEFKPYGDDDDLCNAMSGLGYISEELQNLESLSYWVVNPDMQHVCMVPLEMFPSSLRYLRLSGLGCPWEYLNHIGPLLPILFTLSLESYAFRGPEWDIESKCFLNLVTLIIEDTDLVELRAQHGSLQKLEMLSIQHCYKFKQLDWTRDPSTATMLTIELVDCSPSVISSPMQLHGAGFKVHLHTSYLDEKS
ncbi:putative late blight resistance protein homolog R1A-10 [Salvia splendens]|uniref:putative late blight resistance protein homolog R1A-10 n=1 Tax=Salvia splendens TaxID=180675 RepID=UPI001C266C1F|nr:putative late blight resistance protein homolog R1A-10 [Salvia splendens]